MSAHVLVHNPEEEDDRKYTAEGARACATGEPYINRWSLGTSWNKIRPGGRLFFYRSTEKPRGIFAVGTALPHTDFNQDKEPAGLDLAAYKDNHSRGEDTRIMSRRVGNDGRPVSWKNPNSAGAPN